MLTIAVLLAAFSVRRVAAAPSANSIGSDLTFLFQNDLNWPVAQDHNGTILINKPSTNAQAIASCGQLYETLLPTNGTYFESDMTNLLRYLAYETFDPVQQYWVQSTTSECSAISAHGIQSVSCDEELPAFCSQSAPYRPNTATDMSPQYQVEVKSGNLTVLGTRDHLSFRFVGIPFADPYERWTYSQVYSGSGDINALAYGSPCIQLGLGSEDCLYLNIQTPYLPENGATSSTLRPVMFWIYGGGFTSGDGSAGSSDGGNQASRNDVVTVTINYRLGALGFLALEDGVTNGNYGIADQITALRWVQEHIADFGGDPTRVMIFGASAGAGSVRALLAAKPAFGLFHAAVAQSNLGGYGYSGPFSQYYTIAEEVMIAANPLIEYVNCTNSTDVLACLRAVPAETLVTAPTVPSYVVVDGTYITTDHLQVTEPGEVAPAHVIFGWLRDDGADFIGVFPTMNTTEADLLLMTGYPQNVTDAVIASGLFPVPTGTNTTLDIFNATTHVVTDGGFRCVDQATLYAASKYKVFPSVYAYQLDRSYMGWEPIPGICDPPAAPGYPYGDPNLPYFRCHGGDAYWPQGTLGEGSLPFRDWNDLLMSQITSDAWASFARTGNPNPSLDYLLARGYTNTSTMLATYGIWEQVQPDANYPASVRLLDTPPSSEAFLDQAQCVLLEYPLTYYG